MLIESVHVDPLPFTAIDSKFIINMVQKHQKQRDAPFNGPIVYSTIESIRSEFSGQVWSLTD